MSVAVTEKPMPSKDVAYQVRCSREWLDRVQSAADHLGMSAAAYIRMAVTQRMDLDGIPEPKPDAKKHKSK